VRKQHKKHVHLAIISLRAEINLSLQNTETKKRPAFRLIFSNPDLLSSCTGGTAFAYILLYQKLHSAYFVIHYYMRLKLQHILEEKIKEVS